MRQRLLSLFALLIITALGITLAGAILPGVEVDSWAAAIAASVLVAVLNTLIWPLLIRFALPLTVATLGFGALLLNGALMLIAAGTTPGFEIHGIWGAIGAVLIVTTVTTLGTGALSIDEDERLRRHRANRAAKRSAIEDGGVPLEAPGLLLLEIDGLAYDVLRRAMRDGNAPNLNAWVAKGTHHLVRWETDWSSQTGACQAGLLHGNNHDMPAFRWWEKDRRRAIVTNNPKDAALLESRISDGKGLLHEHGASRANILSGDATHSLLTMSTVLDVRRGKLGADYASYFSSPYNVARTLLRSIAEVWSERCSAIKSRRAGVQPSIHRGWEYAVMRAWACVVQLDLQISAVLDDIAAGRPAIYTTFLAYDEVAHHSGVERPETLATLRRLDREIGRLARAAEHAPRPYRVVVLADHGQSQGATFLQRYGLTLEALVEQACGQAAQGELAPVSDEATSTLGAALTEGARGSGLAAKAVRGATKNKTVDGAVAIHEEALPDVPVGDDVPEISVMASGCLGLVTFPRLPGRVTLEQIESQYPELLPTLTRHEGIGFVLVRSEVDGAVVLGANGRHLLETGEIEGEDPLAPFGPNAARHVARTDGFSRCPDLVLNSTYWAETDEVAAFEELVGSHGGMGGEQCFPFVLAPDDLDMPANTVGAEQVHQVFRGWLASLGHEAFAK